MQSSKNAQQSIFLREIAKQYFGVIFLLYLAMPIANLWALNRAIENLAISLYLLF